MGDRDVAVGCPLAEVQGEATLEELIPRWNKLFWWSGVKPMLLRMVEADLTLAESIVLRSLQHGPLTVTEAATCLMLSHSAASRAVDRLVRDGYIRREENPDDRRQKRLTLAPRGVALVGEMEGIFANRLRRLVQVLDSEERDQLRALLAKVIAMHAEEAAESPGDWLRPRVESLSQG